MTQAQHPIASPVLSEKAAEGKLIVEQYSFGPNEVEFPSLRDHIITLNIGQPGKLYRCQEGQTQAASMVKGTMTLTPAGQPRQWHWHHQAEVLTIALSPQIVAQAARESELNPDKIELINQFGRFDPQIQHLGRVLLAEMKSPGLSSGLYLDALTNLLTIHLLRNYSVFVPKVSQLPVSIPAGRMQKAIDYIHAHFASHITVGDLAAVVNLSSYHFSRLFRQETGFTPHQYLIRYRIQEAQRLLTQKKLPIAVVAQQVGFSDQSHLTRHFKRLLGVTPSEAIAKTF